MYLWQKICRQIRAKHHFKQAMPFLQRRYIKWLYASGDVFIFNLAFVSSYWIRFGELDPLLLSPYAEFWGLSNLLWIVVSLLTKPYEISRLDSYTSIARKMIRSTLWHFVITTSAFVFLQAYIYSRYHLVLFYASFLLLVIVWRITMAYLLKIYRKLGFNQSNIVIVGYNDLGLRLQGFFRSHPEKGYRVLGFFDPQPQSNPQLIKGDLELLPDFVLKNEIEEIFCSLESISAEQIRQLKQFADRHYKRIKFIPNFGELAKEDVAFEKYGDVAVVLARHEPLNDRLNQLLKRAFDVAFSLGVLVFVLSWLIPLIALLIRLDSKGPIFFKQRRAGKKGKDFYCFKFRTMYVNKEADTKQASRNDSRITKVGRFLRKTSLDEFPQFLNVLLGDMSVVGPRPHPIALNERFSPVIEKFMVRHLVKPGVTGLAQAKGYRGETRELRQMVNRVRMDIFYVENWSFLLDLKIIFWTVFSVLKGDKNAF